MKVLLLSHIFPPAIDGGSRVICKLGQYLESQNHQTLYLSSNYSSTDDFVNPKIKPPCQGRCPEGAEGFIKLPVYTSLRKPLKFINLFLNQDLLRVLQKGPIFKFIPFVKATIRIIKFKPELIIAGPLPTTIVLYARLLKYINNKINIFSPPFSRPASTRSSNRGEEGARRAGGFCKLLINSSFHSTDSDFQQKPLINALKKSDYLWTLTKSESNYFIKNFNIDPKKIILAGNGVDSDFLKSKTSTIEHRRSNILFIGSLASHKRVDLLIKSFSDLMSSLHQGRMSEGQVGLKIAGQKTLFYPQIEKLVKSLNPNIKSKIKFVFSFPQKDLAKLIDNCDLLVLPSIQESFGLVLIEAWARQKPVLCSNIPALKELVEKSKGGLVFKTDDQEDLTKQLKFILNNPKKAQQMGKLAYKYVKNNYTWNKVGEKICQKLLS